MGVHRSLEAAQVLENEGFSAGVIDLRTVSPLHKGSLVQAVSETGHGVVVDEDYEAYGLSGEVAAVLLEAGIQMRYGRVCTRETIPYARDLEDQTLPNVGRIVDTALQVMEA